MHSARPRRTRCSVTASDSAVRDVCHAIETRPASESFGGAWLRTYKERRGTGETALLAGNVAAAVAALTLVVVRVVSHVAGPPSTELDARLLVGS